MENRKETVLFVDDEPNVTQGLIRNLRSEPYRFLNVTSGADALKLLSSEQVDVMITDEKMPGMSGAELVSCVRKSHPEIICMMLSGQADFEAALRAINEGEIYRFLKKPCDPLQIITDIRLALEQKELLIQSRQLLDQYEKKFSAINEMKKQHPQLFEIKTDQEGCIVVGDLSPDSRKKILLDIKKITSRE